MVESHQTSPAIGHWSRITKFEVTEFDVHSSKRPINNSRGLSIIIAFRRGEKSKQTSKQKKDGKVNSSLNTSKTLSRLGIPLSFAQILARLFFPLTILHLLSPTSQTQTTNSMFTNDESDRDSVYSGSTDETDELNAASQIYR